MVRDLSVRKYLKSEVETEGRSQPAPSPVQEGQERTEAKGLDPIPEAHCWVGQQSCHFSASEVSQKATGCSWHLFCDYFASFLHLATLHTGDA